MTHQVISANCARVCESVRHKLSPAAHMRARLPHVRAKLPHVHGCRSGSSDAVLTCAPRARACARAPHTLLRPLFPACSLCSAANEHDTKTQEMDAPLHHPRYYPHTKGVWSGAKDGEEDEEDEEDGEEAERR